MDLLAIAIVLAGVATVTSNPCCWQMCKKNCTRQIRDIKTKVNEVRKNRDGVTTATSIPDEELHRAHAPHERVHDESNKLKKVKQDWEEMAGAHDDDLDRDDHGNQNLAELLTGVDSELTSMQATNVDEETDRFDDVIQF